MKKFILNIQLIGLILISGCDNSEIINPSENLTTVPVMSLVLTPDNMIKLRYNRAYEAEIPIKIDYEKIAHTGQIEAAGAGSRYHPKWSYEILLTDGSLIENFEEYNLSAQIFDPAMIRTNLTAHLYRQLGFYQFESKHIFLKINNEDEGLYQLIEEVDETFFERRNISVYQLYKLGFDSKFSFDELNNPQFEFDKEIPDDNNFTHLLELIHAIDTSDSRIIFASLGKHLDITQYIKYHAMASILNSFDSFRNNFFLLMQSPDSPFEVVPWDFDKTFQFKDKVGLVGENEIIKKLFENDITFNMYKNELQHQIDNYFTEENLFFIIDSTASVIKHAYNLDPYLGAGGRYKFNTEISELKSYITKRRKFFNDNISLLTKNYFE